MDRQFDGLYEQQQAAENAAKQNAPPPPPPPPPKPSVQLFPLSQNEHVVRELSESLDKERARNLLLQGKIQNIVHEVQKYEGIGFSVILSVSGEDERWNCKTLKDCLGLIDLLLRQLVGTSQITNYSIEPLESDDTE